MLQAPWHRQRGFTSRLYVPEVVLRRGPVEGRTLAGALLERFGEGGHGLQKARCPALPLAQVRNEKSESGSTNSY